VRARHGLPVGIRNCTLQRAGIARMDAVSPLSGAGNRQGCRAPGEQYLASKEPVSVLALDQ
jgi:hypothetical protein